jgi:hypothetical protein
MLSTSLKYSFLRCCLPKLNYSARIGSTILLLACTFCSEKLLFRVVTVLRNELPVEESFVDLTLGLCFIVL